VARSNKTAAFVAMSASETTDNSLAELAEGVLEQVAEEQPPPIVGDSDYRATNKLDPLSASQDRAKPRACCRQGNGQQASGS